MNLKTSLFNKSIIKSDLKRLWWISALEVLFAAMMCFAMYDRLVNMNMYGVYFANSDRYLDSFLISGFSVMIFLQIFVGIICSVMAFGYLNKNSSLSFMHSLPVKRAKLYISHMASVAILLIIPIIACALIVLMMRIDALIGSVVSVKHVFYFAIHSCVLAAVSAGIAAFASMIAGNMIAAFGLSAAFMLLPVYIEGMIRTLFEDFLYGYWSDSRTVSEWLYRSANDATPIYLLTLLLIAAVFFLLGLWLYNRRKLENYGEVIVFAKLKPVFTFGAAICAGFLGYLYFVSLTIKHLLLLIPFGIVGIIIAHMLMKRQFTLHGVHKPIIIYSIFVLLVYGGFKTDIFGFERRVPDAENVMSVEVLVNERRNVNDVDFETYANDFNTLIVNQEDIKKVIDLHKYALENRKGGTQQIMLVYNLKNGKELVRDYNMYEIADSSVLEPVLTLHQVKAKKFSVIDGTKKDNLRFFIDDERVPGGTSVSDAEICKRIEEALAKDIEAISYDDYFANPQNTVLTINMEYDKQYSQQMQMIRGDIKYNTRSEHYIIRPSYTNTLAVLDELNLIQKLRPTEDIKRICLEKISRISYNNHGRETETREEITEITMENQGEIEEIYEFIKNTPVKGALNKVGTEYRFILNFIDGDTAIGYMSEVVPPEIVKYFE